MEGGWAGQRPVKCCYGVSQGSMVLMRTHLLYNVPVTSPPNRNKNNAMQVEAPETMPVDLLYNRDSKGTKQKIKEHIIKV